MSAVTDTRRSHTSPILDVDLPAFESGDAATRRAVVDGTMRSLATGFVYVRHDLSEDLLDDAYGRLSDFFALPQERKDRYTVEGANGQTGYTGLLVETAAASDVPDWKEMLNWSAPVPIGHPLRRRFPHRYGDPTLPDEDLPGTTEVLMEFHRVTLELQRRVLRILAVGLGVDEGFFDAMLRDGAALTRALHYPSMDLAPGDEHVWAAEHGDINLLTALPRATASGLQVSTDEGWIAAAPPDGHVIVNTGIMLPGHTPGGLRRSGRAPLGRPVLPSDAVDDAGPDIDLRYVGEPSALPDHLGLGPPGAGDLGDQPGGGGSTAGRLRGQWPCPIRGRLTDPPCRGWWLVPPGQVVLNRKRSVAPSTVATMAPSESASTGP